MKRSSILRTKTSMRILAISHPQTSQFPTAGPTSGVATELEHFKREVLRRQNYTCAVCGTHVRELLDVAHISEYSTDADNRANPANGICLCVYCHRAFDRGLVTLDKVGNLAPARNILHDAVAKCHFSNLSIESRRQLLRGVDAGLLAQRKPK